MGGAKSGSDSELHLIEEMAMALLLSAALLFISAAGVTALPVEPLLPAETTKIQHVARAFTVEDFPAEFKILSQVSRVLM